MGLELADEIFRAGVPESKKLELIYRHVPSFSASDLERTVNDLRADCRYARFSAALIDASENDKLAIEELFSENAVSPKIVASYKWLYTSENKGFISEHFVRNTLPSASISSQKQIVNKISKWVTNTDLGDRLWLIVRNRSFELSSRLLGACSNDMIMKEIARHERCLSVSQILSILRKRFDCGIELIKRLDEVGKLIHSPMDLERIFRYILEQNFERGIELLILTKSTIRLGRHSTRKLLQSVAADDSHLKTLLSLVGNVKQSVLARHAPADVYLKCFLAKFNEADCREMQDGTSRLKWLKHFRDDAKLRALEIWYETVLGSNMIDSFERVPKEFLFLLEEETLRKVVTQHIDLASRSDEYSDEEIQFWESMIPDDEESFTKQKEHFKEGARIDMFLNILRSVFVLKRPQYLERRLRFVVERTGNDDFFQHPLITLILYTFEDEYKFTFKEEIWLLLRKLIDLPSFPEGYYIDSERRDLLYLGLKKVSLDQRALLAEIMDDLNLVHVSSRFEVYYYDSLPEEKRHFFWRESLAYREAMEDTNTALNGGTCPNHLQYFYVTLGFEWRETRGLIERYPKTMQILKVIVSSSTSAERFSIIEIAFVRAIYELLEPFLSPGEAIRQDLKELILKEKAEARKTGVLKAFRRTKIITEDVRFLYKEECCDTNFIKLCGRSLLHAEAAHLSVWLAMLDEFIEKNSESPGVANTFVLKAMISAPATLRDGVFSLCPEGETFDSNDVESGRRSNVEKTNMVKSFRHFNDTGLAFKMTLRFMEGDYLGETLSSFYHHLSRLPVSRVMNFLHEDVVRKDTAVNARKIKLHGVLSDALLFDREVILDILRRLSVREEHDDIKNRVLIAIYKLVKQTGEKESWPMLKTCLDAILIEDRACVKTVINDSSIDKHIPANIEYLMRKVVEFSDSNSYAKMYRERKLSRIASNVKVLPLNLLLPILEETKSLDWSSGPSTTLAIKILCHHVPKRAEVLKSHFATLGFSEFLDLANSTELIEQIAQRCLRREIENACEVLDFLHVVFGIRNPRSLREVCLLKLTKHVLPLLPGKRSDTDLRFEVPTITRAALSVTAGLLEEFGDELHEILVDNFKFVLQTLFSGMTREIKWSKYFLNVFDVGMSPIETVILLRVFGWCRRDKQGVGKLKELYLKSNDESVRAVLRQRIRRWPKITEKYIDE